MAMVKTVTIYEHKTMRLPSILEPDRRREVVDMVLAEGWAPVQGSIDDLYITPYRRHMFKRVKVEEWLHGWQIHTGRG